jgi:hypothetical protein
MWPASVETMRILSALCAAVATLLVLPSFARSAEPVAPVDDDFLEFLGAADSDDQEWNEYMASPAADADLNKSGTKPKTPVAPVKTPAEKEASQGA